MMSNIIRLQHYRPQIDVFVCKTLHDTKQMVLFVNNCNFGLVLE